MSTKYKKFLVPFLFASGFIAFLLNCGFLPPQRQTIESPEIKVSDTEQGIIHKNCLARCPTGLAIDNILVDHDAILLSSNKTTKFADWVAYKTTVEYIMGPERKRNWAKDPKIDARFTFTPKDYAGLSKEPYFFDRGHQAPLASFKNHPKWFVLNYLSNITPQKKNLNRGPWKKLESAERKLVKSYGEAYILTGPYYDKQKGIKETSIQRIRYIIPSGYWKIIAVKQGSDIKTVAFLFPQNTPLKAGYCKYLASILKIEQVARLKFFGGKTFLRDAELKRDIGCTNSRVNAVS